MQKDVSGAQVLARCLSSQGIKFFFIVPTPRLDPLIKALENEKGVRVICARNETAAARFTSKHTFCPIIASGLKKAAIPLAISN